MSAGFTQKTRDLITARASDLPDGQPRCEVIACCTYGMATQMHHRRPRGMGGSKSDDTNLASNGLAVCDACHAHIESGRALARENGWLVRQNRDPAEVVVLRRGVWVFLDNNGDYREAA